MNELIDAIDEMRSTVEDAMNNTYEVIVVMRGISERLFEVETRVDKLENDNES